MLFCSTSVMRFVDEGLRVTEWYMYSAWCFAAFLLALYITLLAVILVQVLVFLPFSDTLLPVCFDIWLTKRALELFLSYLDRMHWFEQWFSHLAVHGNWLLDPTPRDIDLMGMGESNTQRGVRATARHELSCRPLRHTGQDKQQTPLSSVRASLALPSSQEHDTYPVATSSFLLLSSTLALKSKCNRRKMRTQNDNMGIESVRVGRFQGSLVNSEDSAPFHLDCVLLILILLGDFPELNWKLKII